MVYGQKYAFKPFKRLIGGLAMAMMFCPSCKRETRYKRDIGVGTLLAACATMGFWLFAIPFYKKRCKVCGSEQPRPESIWQKKIF